MNATQLFHLLAGAPRPRLQPIRVAIFGPDTEAPPLAVLPVMAIQFVNGEYILSVEADGLVRGMAERIAGQSEALSKRAEGKILRMKEKAPPNSGDV